MHQARASRTSTFHYCYKKTTPIYKRVILLNKYLIDSNLYQTIQQIGIQDDNELPSRTATGNNHEKRRAICSAKSLVQGKRKLNKAKQRCGIQIDYEYDQVAVTYYLLRPQNSHWSRSR